MTIDRIDARLDLADTGARQVFFTTRLAPVLRPSDATWTGLRTKGTNPTLFDAGDPQTLALLVERHHDYPSPDWFGSSITDR